MAWWWDHSNSQAVLILGHGLGEHSGLYSSLVHALLDTLPVSILAFDFRGHGRSPGKRGYVARFLDFTLDWHAALNWAAKSRPGLPLFALGHSNGALAALLAQVESRLPCDALIVSNPSLRVRMPLPGWKVSLGRFLYFAAPWVTLSARLPVEFLTRDPLEQQRRRNDRFVHSRVSAPLFFGMRDAADRIERHADRLTLPLLFLVGGADPIIDPEPTRSLFDRSPSPDKLLHDYPDFQHEPLFELGRERVWSDLCHWIGQRIHAGQC